MKKTVAVLLCCFLLQQARAQISDSTVHEFSRLICSCIDTLNFDKPEAEIKKDFSRCKTFSMADLLNRGLLTPEIITDDKRMAELEKKYFARLSNECTAIKRLLAALNKVPAYREKNADNIFTPPVFFKTYGLLPGEVNNLLHVYNNTDKGDVKYQRLVDIRWTFENEEDALQWHRKKMQQNSENGEPVNELIPVEGARELKIFREGRDAKEMLKGFGIQQRQHYFLFVYKNIVCKVFIATDDKTETRELVPFATAAIQQLKTVLQ
jgi:hypothetical protein